MAKDSENRAGSFETGNTGGVISGFLAEEDEFDRRKLWRLGLWAAASVGAVIVALLASQTSIGWRHEQIAVADLARQSLQIQSVAKEGQSEARRLASAIETLNSDRDRLYSRVAVLEQGLDSVTGAIARQNPPVTSPQAASPAASPVTTAAPAPAASVLAASGGAASAEPPATAQKPSPAPIVTPVAATTATTAEKPPVVITAAEPGPAPASSGAQAASNAPAAPVATPPTPLVALKSMMAPPDPAAGKLIEPSPPSKAITAAPMPEVLASTAPAEEAIEVDTAAPASNLAVQRTEFGVDVGGANSLPGLRALWRGLLKSRSNAALTKLRPIIVIKEGSNGLGMQLRLVAGPINDAAAAAKICAVIIENDRACVITVFEGQRLTMNADEPAMGADAKPQAADIKPASAAKPGMHRHYTLKRTAEPAPKPEPSTLSRMFGTR